MNKKAGTAWTAPKPEDFESQREKSRKALTYFLHDTELLKEGVKRQKIRITKRIARATAANAIERTLIAATESVDLGRFSWARPKPGEDFEGRRRASLKELHKTLEDMKKIKARPLSQRMTAMHEMKEELRRPPSEAYTSGSGSDDGPGG